MARNLPTGCEWIDGKAAKSWLRKKLQIHSGNGGDGYEKRTITSFRQSTMLIIATPEGLTRALAFDQRPKPTEDFKPEEYSTGPASAVFSFVALLSLLRRLNAPGGDRRLFVEPKLANLLRQLVDLKFLSLLPSTESVGTVSHRLTDFIANIWRIVKIIAGRQ
jgi:hypothetical protein